MSDECPVCLETLPLPTYQDPARPIVILGCGHRLHFSCMVSPAGMISDCPLCRNPIHNAPPRPSNAPPPPPAINRLVEERLGEEAAPPRPEFGPLVLSTRPEFDSVAAEAHETLSAIATIKAPTVTGRFGSADVVAVIDVSGSMAGSKLVLVKDTLVFLIQQLEPTDRFALVTFNDSATVKMGLQCMTPQGKAAAEAIILSMEAGNGTNIEDGVKEGMQIIESRTSRNPIIGVMLLTDGLANEGATSKDAILQAVRTAAPQSMAATTRCPLYTFGYGGDHDALLLNGLAQSTGAVFNYVANGDMVSEAFGTVLASLLSPVASHVTLQLTTPPTAVLNMVESAEVTSGGTFAKVELGVMISDQSRDIVFDLTLAPLTSASSSSSSSTSSDPQPQPQPVVKVVCTYTPFGSSTREPVSVSATLFIQRPKAVAEPRVANAQVRRERNRVRCARAMTEAEGHAVSGRLDQARSLIALTMSSIRATASQDDQTTNHLLEDMQTVHEGYSTRAAYLEGGKQRNTALTSAISNQAQTPISAVSRDYSTPLQTHQAMRSKTFVQERNRQRSLGGTPLHHSNSLALPAPPQQPSTLATTSSSSSSQSLSQSRRQLSSYDLVMSLNRPRPQQQVEAAPQLEAREQEQAQAEAQLEVQAARQGQAQAQPMDTNNVGSDWLTPMNVNKIGFARPPPPLPPKRDTSSSVRNMMQTIRRAVTGSSPTNTNTPSASASGSTGGPSNAHAPAPDVNMPDSSSAS